MRIALTLWLVLLAAAAWGQTTSITIPLTVPPPVPITVTIPQGTRITANGVTYLVAGTVSLTPVATVGELPPAFPVLRPTIEQYLKNGAPIEAASVGDELVLTGTNFSDSGVLIIGNDAVPTLSWADGEIRVLLDPLVVTPAPNGSFVTVRRGADGELGWRDGPAIRALPSIVTGFELGRLHGDQVDEIIEAEAPDNHDAHPANKNRRERPRKKPPSQIPAAPVAATQVKPVAAEAAQKEREQGCGQAIALLHRRQPKRQRNASQTERGAPALDGAQSR
jgi:hypothetical protein